MLYIGGLDLFLDSLTDLELVMKTKPLIRRFTSRLIVMSSGLLLGHLLVLFIKYLEE